MTSSLTSQPPEPTAAEPDDFLAQVRAYQDSIPVFSFLDVMTDQDLLAAANSACADLSATGSIDDAVTAAMTGSDLQDEVTRAATRAVVEAASEHIC